MVESWALALAGSPWVFVVTYLFAMIDGFFPPIPSESVVIALAALTVSGNGPNLVLLGLVAAAGAFTGDQIAYLIGRRVPVRTLRFMQSARAQASLDWAERALEHRGASFIIAARYIPVGRVAVNMTAGALGYPRRRFVGLTAFAAVTWAAYACLLGLGAGAWLGTHPVAAVLAGVVAGIVIGLVIDWLLRRGPRLLRRRRTSGTPHVRLADERDAPGAGASERPQVTDRSRSEPAA